MGVNRTICVKTLPLMLYTGPSNPGLTRFVVIPCNKHPKYLYSLQLLRGPDICSDPSSPGRDWRELDEFLREFKLWV